MCEIIKFYICAVVGVIFELLYIINVNWFHRKIFFSFGILRNAELQFLTDVSGHHICPTFKGQEVWTA